MGDRYDDLLENGREILLRLNPSDFDDVSGFNNCPETADVVDNYLTSGDLMPVSEAPLNHYFIEERFRRSRLQNIFAQLLQLRHGHHYVIRGTRPPSSRLTSTHYFVLANIRNRIYVIDAYTHEITSNVSRYIQRQQFNRLEYSTTFEVSEAL